MFIELREQLWQQRPEQRRLSRVRVPGGWLLGKGLFMTFVRKSFANL